nr:MAG TPA: hypothetical protein [Caudoviricetes sp.]
MDGLAEKCCSARGIALWKRGNKVHPAGGGW